MKSIFKSLVLTSVLALASTSLYAGNNASCSASKSDKACCKAKTMSCHSSKHRNMNRSVTWTNHTDRPGVFQSSKGPRFCTAKAMKDRETHQYSTLACHSTHDCNHGVNPSKQDRS